MKRTPQSRFCRTFGTSTGDPHVMHNCNERFDEYPTERRKFLVLEQKRQWLPLKRTSRYPLSRTAVPVRPMRGTPFTGHPASAAHGNLRPSSRSSRLPAPGPPPAGGASPRPGRTPCPPSHGKDGARVRAGRAAFHPLRVTPPFRVPSPVSFPSASPTTARGRPPRWRR